MKSPARPRPALRRLLDVPPWVLVLLVTQALSFLWLAKAWGDPVHSWLGNHGDTEQAAWFLGWEPYALAHGHSGFTTTHLAYPSGGNLLWNTSVLLPAVLVAPITALGGPLLAYNVLLVTAPTVAAGLAYAALRRWTAPLGAAVGALAFAFCPYFVAQASGHLHMVLIGFVPLVALLLDEICVRQRLRARWAGAALGAASAAQLLTSEEILATTAIAAAVAVVTLAVVARQAVRAKIGYAIRAITIAVGVGGALAAYPLYVQFTGPGQIHGLLQVQDYYVTDLFQPLLPTVERVGASAAHGITMHFTGNPTEWTGYLGLPLLLACLLAVVVARRRPVVPIAAVTGAVLLVFSLGPRLHVAGHDERGIPLPWALLGNRSVLQNVLPARLALLVDFTAAVLLAVLVDAVVTAGGVGDAGAVGRSSVRPGARIGTVVLVGAVAVSLLPRTLPLSRIAVPSYFSGGDVRRIPPGSVALVLPVTNGPLTDASMVWQSVAHMRFRMPGGYLIVPGSDGGARFGPEGTLLSRTFAAVADGVAATPSPDLLNALRQALGTLSVHTVIVGPMPNEDAAIRWVTAIVGRPPQTAGGVAAWYDVTGSPPP